MSNKPGLESAFQSRLIRDIKKEFPGCIVLKTDPTYIQGLPDLIILFKDKWAALECKRSAKASLRPNQGYWVEKLNKMSFARIIHPDNRKEVIHELSKTFRL